MNHKKENKRENYIEPIYILHVWIKVCCYQKQQVPCCVIWKLWIEYIQRPSLCRQRYSWAQSHEFDTNRLVSESAICCRPRVLRKLTIVLRGRYIGWLPRRQRSRMQRHVRRHWRLSDDVLWAWLPHGQFTGSRTMQLCFSLVLYGDVWHLQCYTC